MRFVKQLAYGIFYLAIIGAAVWGVWKSNILISPTCFDNRLNQGETEVDCGGPNCEPCELKHLQPIRISAQYFPIGNNTNLVLAFSNPNLNYGATFSYTVNFYNADHAKVYSVTHDTFVYPAEAERKVVEPNLGFSVSQVSGSPEVLIANPAWKPKEEFTAPSIQLRQVSVSVTNTQAVITAVLANRESFAVTEAGIGVVVNRKSSGLPVGASKTLLQNLAPFEERPFTVAVPLSAKFKASEIAPLLFPEARR